MAKATPEMAEDVVEMVEVGLSDATHTQLLWFGRQQGYEVSENETQHQTYAKINAAWSHPTITVPAVIEPPSLPKRHKPFDTDGTGDDPSIDWQGLPEMVTVRILSLGDDSKTEEHLALNGYTYRIQVGQDVTLPREVFKGCILDAQQRRYRSDTELGIGEPVITQAVAFTRIK